MPGMASIGHQWDNPIPCLGSFFEAMYGFKKLTNVTPAITYPTSANEASIIPEVTIHIE